MTGIITWAIAITGPVLALALIVVNAFYWPRDDHRG